MILSIARADNASAHLTMWDTRQHLTAAGVNSRARLQGHMLPLIEAYVRSLVPDETSIMALRSLMGSTASRVNVSLYIGNANEYVSFTIEPAEFPMYPATMSLAIMLARYANTPSLGVDITHIPGVDDEMMDLACSIPTQLQAGEFVSNWYRTALKTYNLWQLDEAGVFAALEKEPPAKDKRPNSFPSRSTPAYLRAQMQLAELQRNATSMMEAFGSLAEFIKRTQISVIGNKLHALVANGMHMYGLFDTSNRSKQFHRMGILLPHNHVKPENTFHTMINTCRFGKPAYNLTHCFNVPITTPTLSLAYDSSTWDDPKMSSGAKAFAGRIQEEWLLPEFADELRHHVNVVDTMTREAYRAFCRQNTAHGGLQLYSPIPEESFPLISKEFITPKDFLENHQIDGFDEFRRSLLIAKLMRA